MTKAVHMRLLEDFKKFAFKGNVVDLAVGVIIGGAFGKIVTALVSDLVMPSVALVLPSGDWRNSGLVLHHAADPKDNVVLKYGDFLGTVLDFLIVAIVLFAAVAWLLRKEREALPATKACPYCLEVIPATATRCKACTSQLSAAPS